MPLLARPHAETWIAWVSDHACGAKHSEPGHADCIRKCTRGGAAIGHPEWKSQPLVLVRESDRSVWIIDNPSSLSGLEGQRVRADVEIHAARKAVEKRVKGGLKTKTAFPESENVRLRSALTAPGTGTKTVPEATHTAMAHPQTPRSNGP